MSFKRISVGQAMQLIANTGNTQIVDIRDHGSYQAGHIPESFHLHGDNLEQYIQRADLQAPLMVVCYHGISSQSAAAYLTEQGFADTYSLDGGFEAWIEAQQSVDAE